MGVLQFCATADAAPSAPGAYILQVDIAENVLVTIAGQSPTELTAGRYLYCGSAKGPGGLRAAWPDTCGTASHCIGISIS
jgi:histidyl-tRNA synthetase